MGRSADLFFFLVSSARRRADGVDAIARADKIRGRGKRERAASPPILYATFEASAAAVISAREPYYALAPLRENLSFFNDANYAGIRKLVLGYGAKCLGGFTVNWSLLGMIFFSVKLWDMRELLRCCDYVQSLSHLQRAYFLFCE